MTLARGPSSRWDLKNGRQILFACKKLKWNWCQIALLEVCREEDNMRLFRLEAMHGEFFYYGMREKLNVGRLKGACSV